MNSKSSECKPGDLVNATIKGVRVVGTNALTGAPTIVDEHGNEYAMPPQAAVERLVTADWPPRAGDLWRDKHGELWFIHKNPFGFQMEPPELMGRTTGGARWTDDVDALLADNAPLTLVYREEAK